MNKAEFGKLPQQPFIPEIPLEAIPDFLKQLPQWVLWTYDWRDGHWTKIPNVVIKGTTRRHFSRVKCTQPSTWWTWEAIEASYAYVVRQLGFGHAGLGFMLNREAEGQPPITVIDLDDVRNRDTGELTDEAKQIVAQLNSYTEVSPSGTGLKIYLQAAKPGYKCRVNARPGIEIYDHVRYVAVTGLRLPGTPATVEPRQSELEKFYHETFPPEPEPCWQSDGQVPVLTNLANQDIIDLAMRARNGSKFTALWSGDWSAFSSQSEADFSLACSLAFYVGPDPFRVEQLLRQSGLRRPKWDRRDYLQRTVARAIKCQRQFYGDKFNVTRVPDELADEPIEKLKITITFPEKKKAPCPPAPMLSNESLKTIGEGIKQDKAKQAECEAKVNETQAKKHAQLNNFNRLSRAEDCGFIKSSIDPNTGFGVSCRTRCRRWCGCEFCRALNEEMWKTHIESILGRLADVYVWRGTTDDSEAALIRLKRAAKAADQSGNYFRIQQPNGYCVIFGNVGFTGSQALTPPQAVDDAKRAIDMMLPKPGKRPITCSREWGMEKREKKKLEDLGNSGKDLEWTRAFFEAIQAKVITGTGKGSDSLENRLHQRFAWQLPERLVSEECINNLKAWLALGEIPPNGDLTKGPPNPSWEELAASCRSSSNEAEEKSNKANSGTGVVLDLNLERFMEPPPAA